MCKNLCQSQSLQVFNNILQPGPSGARSHRFGLWGYLHPKDSSRSAVQHELCDKLRFTEHVRQQNASQGGRRPGQHPGQLRVEAQAHKLRKARASQVPLQDNLSKRQVLQAVKGIDVFRSDERPTNSSLNTHLTHDWELRTSKPSASFSIMVAFSPSPLICSSLKTGPRALKAIAAMLAEGRALSKADQHHTSIA